MKRYNVYNWTVGGALFGLLISILALDFTWDAGDIGTLAGGLILWGLVGRTIAVRRNLKIDKL